MSKGPSGTLLETPASAPGTGRAPRRTVRPFVFPKLESVPRSQIDLVRRLEWMLPDGVLTGDMGEAGKEALRRVFDEDVVIWLDYVHAVPPKALKKLIGDPTFLGVIAPTPHGARGLVELDLVLAHSIIDLLLGAPGESAVARPLTEIEQGVMSYVLLETFKAFSPGVAEPGRHRLRLERIATSIDEGVALLADEQSVAVVELKVLIGAAAAGYLRLHLPASAVHASVPPVNSTYRRARRLQRVRKNLARLKAVRIPLRAEIGRVELTAGDIGALRSGDVMLVDTLTTRTDKGENGTARLCIGPGRCGRIEAAIELVDGRYQAKVERVVLGEDPPPVVAESAAAPEKAAAEGDEFEFGEGEGPPTDETNEFDEVSESDLPFEAEGAERTAVTDLAEEVRRAHEKGWGENVADKSEEIQAEAAELLNDVPLQVVVELARVPITAEEVVSLHVGKILDLGRAPGEPVDLSVNGRVVARGELVEVEGQLGVRIVGMAD